MTKAKRCRGTAKDTIGLGCNELSSNRRLGLCTDVNRCYQKFLRSEKGQERISRSTLLASKKVTKETNRKNREEKRNKKVELMSADQYRAKYVQPIFNEVARLIDYGCPCIATNNFEGKMAGGHYTSVGSNRTIALNLHNIHIQSFHSNSWNGGDDKRYQKGIANTYGENYLSFLDSLSRHRPIKLSKDDFKVIKTVISTIRNDLKKNLIYRDPQARIQLRNKINKEIGIYDEEFSIYQYKKATINY